MIQRLGTFARNWREWSFLIVWGTVVAATRDHLLLLVPLLAVLVLVAHVWLPRRAEATPKPPYVSDPDDVAKLRAVNELSRRREEGTLSAAEFEAELVRIFER